jgi:hypothetical protein
MAVTMKNAMFWGVTLYGSCKNQHFGGKYYLYDQGEKNQRASKSIVITIIPQAPCFFNPYDVGDMFLQSIITRVTSQKMAFSLIL